MPIMFGADEVFEMAEQIERNGRRFYLQAAQKTKQSQVRALLRELAEMEADHESLFAEMRRGAAEEGAPQVEFDPDQDVPRYLQAAADTHVFNVHRDTSEVLAGVETPEQVLQRAIEFEKDSVIFFLGMTKLVPEELGRGKVDGLVWEEMSHIVLLTNQLRALQP